MIPDPIQIALVTALLSAATTYLAMVTKIRRDLEAQYDKDLRERRLAAYRILWTLSEPLALFSPARALSAEDAASLSRRLRKWYFRCGLVMSGAARESYFALQKKLVARAEATGPLHPDIVAELQTASSKMHAALCGDVGSRRPPMIGTASRPWWRKVLRRGPASPAPGTEGQVNPGSPSP